MGHRIIWTRTKDDWQPDQNLWQNDDVKVLHWPLLNHQPVKVSFPAWQPQLLLITSQKALAYALDQEKIRDLLERRIPVACFAKKTFEAVRTAGYQAILLQAAGGESFAKKLIGCYPPSRAWYLASRQPAVAIDQILSQQTWQVSRIELYETSPEPTAPSAEVVQALKEGIAIVCFASPSAAHAFGKWCVDHQDLDLSRIRPIAIGETTAKACRQYFADCSLSPQAELAVLWATAKKLADQL